MIKIIKHGQTEFNCTCNRCGCEFTYEHDDITLTSFVVCPDCGEPCYIGSSKNTKSTPLPIGWPTTVETIPCNVPSGSDACKDCDWWKKMGQPGGFNFVGDIPCIWCVKSPYRVTCDTKCTLSSYINTSNVTKADLTPINVTAINPNHGVATVGEFKASASTILDVDVASFENYTTKTAEIPVAADDVKTTDSCDISASEVVPLSSLPELDLSAKDVITAEDVPTSSDSYINSAIATAKKKRNYKKKSAK